MTNSTFFQFYKTGDVILKVEAEMPIPENTFSTAIQKFRISEPVNPTVVIKHHFSLPDIPSKDLGSLIYRKIPWAIYRTDHSYIYLCISSQEDNNNLYRIAVFNNGHTEGEIFSPDDTLICLGNNTSLSFLSTDQILYSRLLADLQGCIFHSAGMVINHQGFLFVGHSGAGKSTISNLLRNYGQLLCDDRNIIRRLPSGWRVYGTWHHGDIPDVSPDSAPLRAIIFLEQAQENVLVPMENKQEIIKLLPFYIIKPLVTSDWWEKTLDLVGQIAREVPVYRLRFQKSERVIDALRPVLG